MISKKKWPHIKIVEKKLLKSVNAHRQFKGTPEVFWEIVINSSIPKKEKYITLIHEITHCYIDEVKFLDKDDEHKLIYEIEQDCRNNFLKK